MAKINGSRRFGKFSLSLELLECYPAEALDILQHCIIFRAEVMYHQDTIEYEAWCPLFDEVEEGCIMRKYVFCVNRETGELYVT